MDKHDIINRILLEWSLRSPNGLLSDAFSEENMDSLYEALLSMGLSESMVVEFINEMPVLTERGKYPERQAYNKNGLLVTFPTPEYKKRAIARGTHFEQNPKVSQSNLFGGGDQAPNEPQSPEAGQQSMDTQDSTLPKSGEEPPGGDNTPPAATPPKPTGTSSGGSSPVSTQPAAQGQLSTEPIPTSSMPSNVSPPASTPPVPKQTLSPEEIAAQKEVIKQILNIGSDNMPIVPGIGETLREQLTTLTKMALDMKLNEAAKFLTTII